jgi:hypothetical protein
MTNANEIAAAAANIKAALENGLIVDKKNLWKYAKSSKLAARKAMSELIFNSDCNVKTFQAETGIVYYDGDNNHAARTIRIVKGEEEISDLYWIVAAKLDNETTAKLGIEL